MSQQHEAHFAHLAAIQGPPLPPDAEPPCRAEPHLFFTADGAGGDYTAPRKAKALCNACPWRVECFTWAANPANQVSDGVWGAFSFNTGSPDAKFIADYRNAVWPTPTKETA